MNNKVFREQQHPSADRSENGQPITFFAKILAVLNPATIKFHKYLTHGQPHMGQMSK